MLLEKHEYYTFKIPSGSGSASQQPSDCLTEYNVKGFSDFSLHLRSFVTARLLLLLNVEWEWVYFYKKLHIVFISVRCKMRFVWRQWAGQLSPPTVNRCNFTSCLPNGTFFFSLISRRTRLQCSLKWVQTTNTHTPSDWMGRFPIHVIMI